MTDVWQWTHIEVRLVLAMVFMLSAVSKVCSRSAYSGFRGAVTALGGRPAARAAAARFGAALPAAVPVSEAVVAVCLLVPATAPAALLAALALLLAFTGALGRAVRRGATVSCHCFGSSPYRLGRPQLARNAFLLAITALGLPGSDLGPGALSTMAPALPVAVVAALALTWAVALWDDLADLLRRPV